MRWSLRVVGGVVLGLFLVLPALGEDAVEEKRKEVTTGPAPVVGAEQDWREQIKHPTPWLTWGIEQRIMHEYIKNQLDLNDDTDDAINWLRLRTRLWAKVGPFFQQDIEAPNGLNFFVRWGFAPRPTAHFLGDHDVNAMWTEVYWDNLYVEWARIMGLPVSIKVGRQDLILGRGWLVLEGTPLDGARSIFCDAAVLTFHLDDLKSALTFVTVDNKGESDDRLRPIETDHQILAEFDQKIHGVAFTCNAIENHQFGAYFLYKNDDNIDALPGLPTRIVKTLGVPVEGKISENWDYYGEAALQWGEESGMTRRRSWGTIGELGYTFRDAAWAPRVILGYEFLSGDDPKTDTFEGWDSVASRYPRASELFAYTTATEAPIGNYTNLHRFTLGVHARPTEKMLLCFEGSELLADEHTFGSEGLFAGGQTRGTLLAGKMFYDFTDWAAMHLWGEYFLPSTYYNSAADNAFFLRWQLEFKF